MNTYLTDTQALVKHLTGKWVIKAEIDSIFKQADKGQALIIVPATVLFEIAYLNEKGRFNIPLDRMTELLNCGGGYQEHLLDFPIIKTSFEIKDIKELHDRLIAGTARHLNLPVLTNDPIILASQFVTCI